MYVLNLHLRSATLKYGHTHTYICTYGYMKAYLVATLLFAQLCLQQFELALKSKQHSNDRINAEAQKQQQ